MLPPAASEDPSMPMLTRDEMYNAQNVPIFGLLVIEFCYNRAGRDKSRAVFTIRDEKEGFISLKKLFVEHTANDPSEAEFADIVFGDVGYWLRVRETKEIKTELKKWREEADVIRKSQAFKAIVKEVKEEGRSAFSAAKYLIEEPWKGTTKKTKQAVKATTTKAFDSVTEDRKRLMEAGLLQ